MAAECLRKHIPLHLCEEGEAGLFCPVSHVDPLSRPPSHVCRINSVRRESAQSLVSGHFTPINPRPTPAACTFEFGANFSKFMIQVRDGSAEGSRRGAFRRFEP